MSDRTTPETEQVKPAVLKDWHDLLIHAFKLERERDEAQKELHNIRLHLGAAAEDSLFYAVCVIEIDRDHAREDLENSRQSLEFALEELDEARSALMKIEQLFIDGTDVYEDRERMATIAIEALEGAK